MRRRKKLKKGYKKVLMLLLISITLCLLVEVGYYYMTLNKELTPVYNHEEYFYASDFGINVIKSETDYDNDGIDDYSDILLGAQKERDRNPIYVSKYYDGGYPPDDEGVCTDVIWRALKEAGYYLNLSDLTDGTTPALERNVTYRFEYDVKYVDDITLVGDMKIIFRTVIKVLKHDGISSGTSATMEAFTGNKEKEFSLHE